MVIRKARFDANGNVIFKRKHKWLKIFLIILLIIILIPVLVVGIYVIYVFAQYHRIGNQDLDIHRKSAYSEAPIDTALTYTSYNFGFGAYSTDYTFFMDSAYDENGNSVSGYHGTAKSKEDVEKNVTGLEKTIKELDSDFYAFQEIDLDSTRSFHINQNEAIQNTLTDYDNTFAVNYDSAYLFYPFYEPIGKSLSGLGTYSSYQIQSGEREEYTISTGFSKFFDLDRCFSINRINVENGKQLVLINSHMSAYDEGGTIRNQQIKELNEFMIAEEEKGNYVICAGDFNHDLLTNNPMYDYTSENFAWKDWTKQHSPDWLSYMFDENGNSPIDSRFTVWAANNLPSCRDCDVTWQKGYTFVSTVDGFIVSSNVSVDSVLVKQLGDNGFEYSDHQPTTLTFKLNQENIGE